MLILFILACAWPSPTPIPSQPLIVEVSLGDTDSSPPAGHTRSEAVDAAPQAAPQTGGAEPRTNPGVEGDHD